MTRLGTAEMVDGVTRWVACESPTADAAAVNRMIDLVSAELAEAPVGLERRPGQDGCGDVLIARAGPATGAPHALLLSHVDTVHPLGTIERDLPIRIEGDRLYGPGAMDMKGGAYMGMAAFRQAAREGSLARPTVYLFTPDEEIGSVTTRAIIEDHARGAAHALVTEPARPGGRVVTARRGSGRYEVKLRGVPAHSGGAPEKGRSAIREAAHQILAIEALTDGARGVNATVGLVNGGTAANTVPEHAWFMVDFRMEDPADEERLDAHIRNLRPVDADVRITVEGRITRPPYRKSESIERLHEAARGVAAGLGLELDEIELAGGGSDGNFTAALGVPTLDGLGVEGFGAHTLDEHALIPSIPIRTELLFQIMTRL